MTSDPWEFWIDVGGTFTDCFARRPDGKLLRHKLLSSGVVKGTAAAGSDRGVLRDPARLVDPAGFWDGWRLRMFDALGVCVGEAQVRRFDRATGELALDTPLPFDPPAAGLYELYSPLDAPIVAIRYLLALGLAAAIPAVHVRLGTTRGTNALITRRGARTALVTTRGFGDVLDIGYQNRPRLFDLDIRKPERLAAAVVEIDERTAADGAALKSPDRDEVARQLRALKSQGIESLAICLLHSFAHPAHERQVAEVARQVGFEEISVSCDVAPLVKLVSRADTTSVDAYLTPVLRSYIARLSSDLAGSELKVLTSAGGLVAAPAFVGKDSILSGPAGGVVGFSRVAQAAGFERAIGFDMGGTSTDVSRFQGSYELEYETEKAGVRIVAPMMAIETVAAGGGSICRFDGVKLVVGPESAGADPGPACYGRGGPLTITDVNLLLGKIPLQRFPFPLSRAAAEERLARVAAEIAVQGKTYEPAELAEGFVRVANAHMAKAVRSISVAKGYDVREYLLVPFGGAAGQHACAIADELQIGRILCHPDAGVLSAYGIGLADVSKHRVLGVYQPYSEPAVCSLETQFQKLAAAAAGEMLAAGASAERLEIRRALDLRYQGVEQSLSIGAPEAGSFAAAFAAEHHRLYGYVHAARELEIVALRVEVRGRSPVGLPPSESVGQHAVAALQKTRVFLAGRWQDADMFDRAQLRPGDVFAGPAIVVELSSTTVVDPQWTAEVLSQGELLLRRASATPGGGATVSTAPDAGHADPIWLEIFNHQFAGVAEQMGITLRNTATSVNVKERLDFSCAIFTPQGDLVVNAPHIPVHLGAMSETVKRILLDNPGLGPGDVFVTNHPYRGGSHLPDVTVITPVFDTSAGQLSFFTASRAHHAEIGGIVPGSMPPFSKNLAEEGVLIGNFQLFAGGQPRWDELAQLLASGPFPSRSVATNLADIAAQVAANRRGLRDLNQLAERYTLPVVAAYMRHIQAAAAEKVRRALGQFKPGRYHFADHLDDGSTIAVTIAVDGGRAVFDFQGTGPVLAGNFNANRAITTSAVLYVLRALVDEDIPLNQGILTPVEIVLPVCLLNPPEQASAALCAAVAGGNVETSQRVVDVLLGALGLAAASQGTMNNLIFGNRLFGYYETICGGAGATARAAGASAVHTHMTNTRITDPEILERRYPVRLWEFAVRRGSGGAGAHAGGDGVVRRIEFLEPLEVSLVTSRRGPYPPYGLAGGEPGALGRNTLIRAGGEPQQLAALAQFQAQSGDQLILETPGGGGWGDVES